MIRTFGEIALYLALFVACLQAVFPLWGHAKNNIYALACARPFSLAQFIFVFMAYGLMTLAFVTNDFSIAYVAENSHASLPFIYKLTAVWGAHEGSILLWILILNVWTAVLSFTRVKDQNIKTMALALSGLISFCFLCFLLFTSNPFLAAARFSEGNDLTPLLQDPGFVIHPPMLYLGYAGFSLPFTLTLSALVNGKLDKTWACLTRRFTLAAWCFLTLGITLGSWWSYRVLGWGGFWFWDPVENASLLPWLSSTALIHVLVLCEKRNTSAKWGALLSIITFGLSLLGTFLVRSGVLISVHTFANDPSRGIFLLLLLAVLITGTFILYLKRAAKISSVSFIPFHFFSRENALLMNSILLMTAMLTILLGTLYPLIVDALHLGAISVGPPYFNSVMMPLTFILLLIMGVGALLNWQQTPLKNTAKQALKKLLLSVISAGILLWGLSGSTPLIALLSLSFSFWVIASVQKTFRFFPAMSIAHIGFAVLMIGILLSSLLSQEREVRIQPGEHTELGPYQFYFLNTKTVDAANYHGIQANFEVRKNRFYIANLYPEKRIYTVRNMVTTKVDIQAGLFRDLYIALGEPLENANWSVRIYYKPFVRWIWFGGLIMIAGGVLAIRRDPKHE